MSQLNCLITGASRGLGRALAKAFWAAGANLILLGRTSPNLDSLIAELGASQEQRVLPIAVDFSDPSTMELAINLARSSFSTLDVLINNAAIQGPIGELQNNSWEEWTETIQTNLLSPIALCKGIAPWMTQQGSGCILNISGGGATSPRPYFSAYATAKAGLVRFSETLAEELEPYSIRVNCIAPGSMKTSMLSKILEVGQEVAGHKEIEAIQKVMDDGGACMGRVAELALFLASDKAKGITGKLISAVWDPWTDLPHHLEDLKNTDIYTLRRITPRDRGKLWGNES